MNQKSKILLKIVKTWKINKKPEYRGFRCAYCQQYMNKAYYYWLDNSEYKTPVHFCRRCREKLESGQFQEIRSCSPLKTPGLEKNFSQEYLKIIEKWNTRSEPRYKTFICDSCGKNMHKAYHIWLNIKNCLVEIHFCRKCGDKRNVRPA